MASSEVTTAQFEESEEFAENTSESDFYEVSSSEADYYSTSDDEDAERWEALLEGAYACSPSVFKHSTIDPVERTSLLLLDKDFYCYENDFENERKLPCVIFSRSYTIPWFRRGQ